MRLGVYLPASFPDGVPAAKEVRDYAVLAEELGFDALWAGDHLLWRAPMAEPLTTLAYLAAATTRIRLGVNVYLAGLRPPVLSARLLGNLWWLSGGRLELGVGVGGDHEPDFTAMGVPVGQRGRLLDDALAEIRYWWSGADPDHSVAPRPDAGCPLWIGGRSEAALRRVVAQRADGFTAHLVTADQFRKAVARLRELCDSAGSAMPRVAVTVMVDVHTGGEGDGEEFLRAHFGENFPRLSRFLVSGPAEECADRLAEYAGTADHVIILPATFTPRAQLPHLRRLVEAT